jgi:hypothetical protein
MYINLKMEEYGEDEGTMEDAESIEKVVSC